MIEGNNNPENDDLAAYADYLAEFDSIVNFDNETCPICGVSISETESIQKSPYVLYKCVDKEDKIIAITKELELKFIPFKLEKRLDTIITDPIVYLYDILVPIKYLTILEKKI